MLNALGNAACPVAFRDVAIRKELSKVKPADILGRFDDPIPSPLVPEYSTYFPGLQSHWLANRDFVFEITDLHDVSKHRQTIYTGGQLRNDPPKGFFESLGAHDDPTKRILLSPHAEILVKTDPKGWKGGSAVTAYTDRWQLEPNVERFCTFIERSCELALDDACANIKLPGRQPDFGAEAVRSWVRETT